MIKGNTEFDYGFDASYNFQAVGKTNTGETVGSFTQCECGEIG